MSKDLQCGDRVKFLGLLVDSTQRSFCVPQNVCEKALKMIEAVCRAQSEGRPLYLSDLQRVTGKLISLRLAIPSVPVWLRSLYFCFPEDLEDDVEVGVSKLAVRGLKKVEE